MNRRIFLGAGPASTVLGISSIAAFPQPPANALPLPTDAQAFGAAIANLPAIAAVSSSLLASPRVVSVRDFGALGDASTDDTAAIQAAIDSIANSGVIYFPPGNYSTRQITTGVKNEITLQG